MLTNLSTDLFTLRKFIVFFIFEFEHFYSLQFAAIVIILFNQGDKIDCSTQEKRENFTLVLTVLSVVQFLNTNSGYMIPFVAIE